MILINIGYSVSTFLKKSEVQDVVQEKNAYFKVIINYGHNIPLRARAYQTTAALTSTCLRTEVNDHKPAYILGIKCQLQSSDLVLALSLDNIMVSTFQRKQTVRASRPGPDNFKI
jgi:hypothetical protein